MNWLNIISDGMAMAIIFALTLCLVSYIDLQAFTKMYPQMIYKSRFKDYYNELNGKEQLRLTTGMSQLIKENAKYADSKNYGV